MITNFTEKSRFHWLTLISIAESGNSRGERSGWHDPRFSRSDFPESLPDPGLYPEHHGIVAMSFYDPIRKQKYAFNDSQSDSDGSWYGGIPLWSLAEQQGMRSACFLWPGSEAKIADSPNC